MTKKKKEIKNKTMRGGMLHSWLGIPQDNHNEQYIQNHEQSTPRGNHERFNPYPPKMTGKIIQSPTPADKIIHIIKSISELNAATKETELTKIRGILRQVQEEATTAQAEAKSAQAEAKSAQAEATTAKTDAAAQINAAKTDAKAQAEKALSEAQTAKAEALQAQTAAEQAKAAAAAAEYAKRGLVAKLTAQEKSAAEALAQANAKAKSEQQQAKVQATREQQQAILQATSPLSKEINDLKKKIDAKPQNGTRKRNEQIAEAVAEAKAEAKAELESLILDLTTAQAEATAAKAEQARAQAEATAAQSRADAAQAATAQALDEALQGQKDNLTKQILAEKEKVINVQRNLELETERHLKKIRDVQTDARTNVAQARALVAEKDTVITRITGEKNAAIERAGAAEAEQARAQARAQAAVDAAQAAQAAVDAAQAETQSIRDTTVPKHNIGDRIERKEMLEIMQKVFPQLQGHIQKSINMVNTNDAELMHLVQQFKDLIQN